MIERILGTGIIVGHLDRAIEFYANVLGFEHDNTKEMLDETWAAAAGMLRAQIRSASMVLRVGSLELGNIELIEVISPQGRPIPPDSRSNDLWFQHVAVVVADIGEAYARLRQHRVQHVSSMPQTLPDYLPNAAGIRAFYFRDPDGHNLELIQFPPDKGSRLWHETASSGDTLFLGIDHTAITVSSTPRSLAFYRDLLGLQTAGTSENYGTEQEHLNMVFGAHVQITGLKAPTGVLGLEFLEYLSPPGGRSMPADTQCNDLWCWETWLLTKDLDGIIRRLPLALPEPETVMVWGRGSGKQVVIHDPDGHVLRIVED